MFKNHHALLKDIGVGELTEEKIKKVRHLFAKCTNKMLKAQTRPDVCYFHEQGVLSHYHQHLTHCPTTLKGSITKLWCGGRQISIPVLPLPETLDWSKQNDDLIPILMDKEPIPKPCIEMISCNCSMACKNNRCKCRKSNLFCSQL